MPNIRNIREICSMLFAFLYVQTTIAQEPSREPTISLNMHIDDDKSWFSSQWRTNRPVISEIERKVSLLYDLGETNKIRIEFGKTNASNTISCYHMSEDEFLSNHAKQILEKRVGKKKIEDIFEKSSQEMYHKSLSQLNPQQRKEAEKAFSALAFGNLKGFGDERLKEVYVLSINFEDEFDRTVPETARINHYAHRIAHELGHALSLRHPKEDFAIYNLMYPGTATNVTFNLKAKLSLEQINQIKQFILR